VSGGPVLDPISKSLEVRTGPPDVSSKSLEVRTSDFQGFLYIHFWQCFWHVQLV